MHLLCQVLDLVPSFSRVGVGVGVGVRNGKIRELAVPCPSSRGRKQVQAPQTLPVPVFCPRQILSPFPFPVRTQKTEHFFFPLTFVPWRLCVEFPSGSEGSSFHALLQASERKKAGNCAFPAFSESYLSSNLNSDLNSSYLVLSALTGVGWWSLPSGKPVFH